MNKCTLLVDGNWMLQSRTAVLFDKFEKNNPLNIKQAAADELTELMARSINVVINRFRCIDNIVIVADGGSWRKQLPIPSSVSEIVYKGNRQLDKEFDWDLIYKTFNTFIDHCKSIGLTVTQFPNIEGDDWIWYWTKRLNAEGTSCVIWSVDNDLKQLVQLDPTTKAFTVWYNDKNGLWINDIQQEKPISDIDFFLNPQYQSPILESLKSRAKSSVNYINPNSIILSKIICGDSGDNIKSVFRYQKNNRTYKVTEKVCDKMMTELNINNIDDLIQNVKSVAKWICSQSTYKSYSPDQSKIEEMIEYNIKLVWLDEHVIPTTLITTMTQQEYKEYDISYIKSNYKILIKSNEEDFMRNLFEDM